MIAIQKIFRFSYFSQLEYHHYEQKIRNLEHENLELHAEVRLNIVK